MACEPRYAAVTVGLHQGHDRADGCSLLSDRSRSPSKLDRVDVSAAIEVSSSCWNGRVTKFGDETHMAYATDFRPGEDNGVQGTCPETHPYKVPRLFYEVMVCLVCPR